MSRNIFESSSSAIFGNFRKMLGNVRATFGQILESLRKSSESGRKSSENRQIRRHHYVYIIKRTLHVSSKIWVLCSRCQNNIKLVRCAHSWDIVLVTWLEHKIHIFSPPCNILYVHYSEEQRVYAWHVIMYCKPLFAKRGKQLTENAIREFMRRKTSLVAA